MADPVTVKLAPSDLAEFRAIRLEALRMAPQAFANTESDWAALSEGEWRRRLENPVFVVRRGSEPVGIMGLLRHTGTKTAHRARLIMVYMRACERGTGLTCSLLAAVMDFARQSGIRQIELEVSDHNAGAIRFYERHGFTQIGRLPGAIIDQGREIDELIMMRRLDLPRP